MPEKSIRIVVSGRVQGVGFRAWVQHTAKNLGLNGWVRNLKSGEVEMIVSGDEEIVARMESLCWDGPVAASVDEVQVSDSFETVESGFSLLPTD